MSWISNPGVVFMIVLWVFVCIILLMQWYDNWKIGHEHQDLCFVSVKHALPPSVFGKKELVSEKVIVKLEAGSGTQKSFVYEVDTYDHDLKRWTNFYGTETHEYKVIKWAPLPKVK